jgi:glutathione S-transferase
MTLIVHGRATSSNVQAVMWGIAELGLDVDRRDVGGRFGGNDTPEFLRMNPMGKVPVLQDGDVVLFESAAILRYLVARYGGGKLASDPRGESWAEWAKNTMGRAFVLDVFWPYYRTPEARRDMDAVIRGLRGFETLAAMAMEQRGRQRFMMGDSLSLADIWAGHVLFRYFTLDLPRDVPDGLQAYYDDLCANPHYARHVMVDYSELKAGQAS